MRVLLARASILSVCVLAVLAATTRGQSPTLTNVPPGAGASHNIPAVKTGDARDESCRTTLASHPSWKRCMATINRLEMRVKELENKVDKGATEATPSVAAAEAVKVDAVKDETVTTEATATNSDVGAAAPPQDLATPQDLSWTKGDFKITLYGAVKLDAYYNSARTQGPGMPAFLVPKFVGGFSAADHSFERPAFDGRPCSSPDPISGNSIPGGRYRRCFSTTPMSLQTVMGSC